MRYGEAILDDILRRTDLVQLVGKRVKLERKGRVFWGLCPFHKEKSPSFKVENERRTYHCFGCGAGGDAFKWLRETEGLSFPEAVNQLADAAGVQLPAWTPEEEEREAKRNSLYDVIELAAKFYEEQLYGNAGAPARAYLKSRGLNGEICKRFRIGFAPDASGALIERLLAANIPLAQMIEAGVARAADDNRPARDFFFNRVMFPIEDFRGRVVAFGGRALQPDAKPKYINTADTVLFSKGRFLYNFRRAREAVAQGAPLILAEGYMDVIALSEAGFGGAVAPLGTALTDDQLHSLWRLNSEPIVCLDGDDAGMRAARRAARLALPHLKPDHSLRFIFLPKGEDPDSFLRAQGAPPMHALIAKAQGLADVLWTAETEGRDFATPERRAGLEASLERVVKDIRDPKIADYYKRDFADRVFAAFKQRRAPAGGQNARKDWPSRAGGYAGRNSGNGVPGRQPPGQIPGQGAAQGRVSPAVRHSHHVVNAKNASRLAKEQDLLALAVENPNLLDRDLEILAKIAVVNPDLDRLKRELLHLAASGVRLEKSVVENHLTARGLSVLMGELKNRSVLHPEAAAGGVDDAWRLTMAQLQDPDFSLHGELKLQRDAAFARYLNSGAEADLDEMQRLNGLIRAQAGL